MGYYIINLNNNNEYDYIERSGIIDVDDLKKSPKVFIHQGKTLVEKVKSTINNPKFFSEEVKKAIQNMNCKIGEEVNIHILSSKAKYLDGLYRICHIKDDIKNERIIIKEFHDARSAKFSALYNVLRKEMVRGGISINKEKKQTYIPYDLLDKFVEAVNIVNEKVISNKYDLTTYHLYNLDREDNWDKIRTDDGTYNLFNKVEWKENNTVNSI